MCDFFLCPFRYLLTLRANGAYLRFSCHVNRKSKRTAHEEPEVMNLKEC